MPLPKFSLQFAFSWSVYFSNRTESYSSQNLIEFAGPHGTIGRKRLRTWSLVGADLGQLVMYMTSACMQWHYVHDVCMHAMTLCTWRLHACNDIMYMTSACMQWHYVHDVCMHAMTLCTWRLHACNDIMYMTSACMQWHYVHDVCMHAMTLCTWRLHACNDIMYMTSACMQWHYVHDVCMHAMTLCTWCLHACNDIMYMTSACMQWHYVHDVCMQCTCTTYTYLRWSGIANAVDKFMYVDIFEKRIGAQPPPPND